MSVKQRLTLHRKDVGDNSMPSVRQDRISTYAYARQLISIWSKLYCFKPMPSGHSKDSGIHGTIEPVWRSDPKRVSESECISPQQPSMRGLQANRRPK